MMKTKVAFYRSRAVLAAGMLLTTTLAGGCITQKPGATEQNADTSKPARTKLDRKHHDNSKDAPSITHPAG